MVRGRVSDLLIVLRRDTMAEMTKRVDPQNCE